MIEMRVPMNNMSGPMNNFSIVQPKPQPKQKFNYKYKEIPDFPPKFNFRINETIFLECDQ